MSPELAIIDWAIIIGYIIFAIGLGSYFTKKASQSVDSFFVGDRKYPWWLAGTSIVATTFAADTPLAVTGIVANQGISGNWIWWSWGIAHLVATFFFAHMWRRSGVLTDAEITEIRYSGKAAAFLRGFKAIYFGVFINCLTMAWVIAAMVKISQAFFDWPASWVIAGCITVSVTYTTLGGFRSVVITDFIQFLLGMGGAILLAIYVLSDFGGMGDIPTVVDALPKNPEGLLPALGQVLHQEGKLLSDWLDFVPRADHPTMPVAFFIVFLFAGWWRYAEGNGYMVQRLASCKDEKHAQAASLWFAVAHNALRPWPWFLVALASLVVYPQLTANKSESITLKTDQGDIVLTPTDLDVHQGGTIKITGATPDTTLTLNGQTGQTINYEQDVLTLKFGGFKNSGALSGLLSLSPEQTMPVTAVRAQLLDREMGYPLLMKHYLPAGLLGLMLVSLLAAFMSTIDTHTNWGASYLVQDLYLRFIRPNAPPQHAVTVSRFAIVFMALLAGLFATFVHNIAAVWQFLVTLGAGLGSVSAVRWYWSRVTPQAEIAAIVVTTFTAVFLQVACSSQIFGGPNPFFLFEISGWLQILLIAGISLLTWIPVSLWGPQNDPDTLAHFAEKIQPAGPGWNQFRVADRPKSMGPAFIKLCLGLIVMYGTLFGIGDLMFGRNTRGCFVLLLAVAAAACLWHAFRSDDGRQPRKSSSSL